MDRRVEEPLMMREIRRRGMHEAHLDWRKRLPGDALRDDAHRTDHEFDRLRDASARGTDSTRASLGRRRDETTAEQCWSPA